MSSWIGYWIGPRISGAPDLERCKVLLIGLFAHFLPPNSEAFAFLLFPGLFCTTGEIARFHVLFCGTEKGGPRLCRSTGRIPPPGIRGGSCWRGGPGNAPGVQRPHYGLWCTFRRCRDIFTTLLLQRWHGLFLRLLSPLQGPEAAGRDSLKWMNCASRRRLWWSVHHCRRRDRMRGRRGTLFFPIGGVLSLAPFRW